MTWHFASAARSETGFHRRDNEDAGWAGEYLIAVADGMGGHVAGEVASAVAVASLAPLDGRIDPELPNEDVRTLLESALSEAEDRIRAMVDADPELQGMGTTLTALLLHGKKALLLHVGDSRAYRLRNGQLAQLTTDHTVIQELLDRGEISEGEASTHPKRSMMTQALMGTRILNPQRESIDVQIGDRLLLCSDGLSGVVGVEQMRLGLAAQNPRDAVNTLVALAHDAGAPDNVTAVVADVVAAPSRSVREPAVGAARRLPRMPTFNRGLAIPHLRRWTPTLFIGAALALLGVTLGGWAWSNSQYFVASAEGRVAIYQGLAQPVGPFHLSSVYRESAIEIDALPVFERIQVRRAITAASLADAERIVARLQERADACADQRSSGEAGPLDCGPDQP
jgi:PPM family protein phosphatase